MAKEKYNTLIQEDTGMVMINKKIKDCNQNNLFSFLKAHFSVFFLDLQELRNFITYLQENKSENIVKDVLEDFKNIIKNFK